MKKQSPAKNHISVCICTFKRPQMLSNLLSSLQNQKTENLFTYSVIVVDNDIKQSAEKAVNDFLIKSLIPVDYHCESEQNIALARNKAVSNTRGNFIAFIDDDEFPNDTWLLNLFKAQRRYRCAGVLGPVKPFFKDVPPKWITKGRICERQTFPTGTIIHNSKHTRTGNVLLESVIFKNDSNFFDRRFGKTGGEDVDFFQRMLSQGYIFVWCNEASVYEFVSPERFKRSYYLKRALMRGEVNSKKISLFSVSALESVAAFVVYTTSLPLFLLLGHHLFMKYLIKDCDHIGKILGLFGIYLIKGRSD